MNFIDPNLRRCFNPAACKHLKIEIKSALKK